MTQCVVVNLASTCYLITMHQESLRPSAMGVRVATWHQPAKVLSPHNATDAQPRSELNQSASLRYFLASLGARFSGGFGFVRNFFFNGTTFSLLTPQSAQPKSSHLE